MYIILSWPSDGSQEPELNNTHDEDHAVGDLLNYVGTALEEHKQVEVFKVNGNTLNLIYSTKQTPKN